jgi:hypothetical protein
MGLVATTDCMYQYSDNEVKDVPVVLPKCEEVVNPLEQYLGRKHNHSEGINEV